MYKKSNVAILMILLLPGALIFAEEPANGGEEFHRVFNSWINCEAATEVIIGELNVLEKNLEGEAGSWENCYWRAKVSLGKGQIHMENNDKENSIMELEKSRRLSRMSIELKNFSDSWRLMADAGSYIMLQKGLAYIISHSSKVQDYADTALELDPENARASLIIAQYLTNAPRIAGGNMRKGIELYQSLSFRTDLNREDRFYIFLGLCEALEKNKQYDDAAQACLTAWSLFPGNLYAQDKLTELQSR